MKSSSVNTQWWGSYWFHTSWLIETYDVEISDNLIKKKSHDWLAIGIRWYHMFSWVRLLIFILDFPDKKLWMVLCHELWNLRSYSEEQNPSLKDVANNLTLYIIYSYTHSHQKKKRYEKVIRLATYTLFHISFSIIFSLLF